MYTRRIFATFAVLTLSAWAAFAKPNFTGDWKMNPSKSDYGPMPAPDSLTEKITHDDPKLKLNVKQSGQMGEVEYELNYTTDGKECTNELRGNPMKSTLKWEGDALIIDSKGKFGDNDVTIHDKWNLSEDGKTLTIDRHFESSMGAADAKVVLEKQ